MSFNIKSYFLTLVLSRRHLSQIQKLFRQSDKTTSFTVSFFGTNVHANMICEAFKIWPNVKKDPFLGCMDLKKYTPGVHFTNI